MSSFAGARRRSATLPVVVAVMLLFLAAVAAFLLLGCSEDGRDRFVFFFPASPSLSSSSARSIKEVRLLDTEGRDPLAVFLSDILLGSLGRERVQPFASKCELNRCFVRGNAAYIDIAAYDFEKVASDPLFYDKFELFKKNVCTNFENIDTIYLYFDGVEVYAEKH